MSDGGKSDKHIVPRNPSNKGYGQPRPAERAEAVCKLEGFTYAPPDLLRRLPLQAGCFPEPHRKEDSDGQAQKMRAWSRGL